MTSTGSRRDARERAVELLYEADAKGLHPIEVAAALPLPTDPYALELAGGVADHRIEIDHLLDRFATGWPVSRMAAMDRTVLRTGAFELAAHPEVPTGACLSEAVELGSRFGSADETPRFVNGLLARIAKEVRGGPSDWLPIDAVVFDMDGVFRHWTGNLVGDFEAAHGLTAGSIGREAFSQPLFDDAMTGAVTAEEWGAEVGRRLAVERPGLDVEAVARMWCAVDWEVDEAVVALARRIHDAGARTALLSNASTHLEADLATIGIDSVFDVVVNSSRIGRIKPTIEAYEAATDLVGAAANRILFVDDRPENVRGALAAGWHGVQMRDAARLEAVLARLGVPGARVG